MTDKEKADSLIELQKGLAEYLRQTRNIEFKVNIALWSLIVAAGSVFLSNNNLNLRDPVAWFWFLTLVFTISVGHLVLWMIPIQLSENHG